MSLSQTELRATMNQIGKSFASMRMNRNIVIVAARVSLAFVALLVLPGCIHWPDAPYMDTTESLPHSVLMRLQPEYANPTLLTPVYRLHMEDRMQYQVVSQVFVFRSNGKLYRGEIEADDTLLIRSAAFVEKLPAALQQRFFDGPNAVVPGGKVKGPIWRNTFDLSEQGTPDTVYEFEFIDHGSPGPETGLGQIGTYSKWAAATRFRPGESPTSN